MATPEQRQLFSRVLRRTREENGMSQRTFAATLGVSPSAVSQWEHAETAPRPEMAAAIERALSVEPETFQRLLGYLVMDDDVRATISVLEAVERDPRLDDGDRELLSSVYRQLVRRHGTQNADKSR